MDGLAFAEQGLDLAEGLTVSFRGTPATPVAETFPVTVVAGRHLPLILIWPFLHFLAFLAARASLREIVPVGTVTTSVAAPACVGTNVIVIDPSELALMLWTL